MFNFLELRAPMVHAVKDIWASRIPASELASSQVTQQQQFPTNSQSQSQSAQEEQRSQPVCPWSAHAPPFGQSPSPFLRKDHALSTSATPAGELFLFGGYEPKSLRNDLFVISTQDFSTTLLQTSGDVPSPSSGYRAVLTSTTLLISGGSAQNQSNDDYFFLLNFVSREWTRIVVNGPGPGGRYNHTMTLVGSKLFVIGGRTAWTRKVLNDIWALDLNYLKSNPRWESYEPVPGNKEPLRRSGHVSVSSGDHIIIFGGCSVQHVFNDTWSFNTLTRKWTELQCTGSIPPPCAGHAAVLIDDIMYVFGGSTQDRACIGDLTALNLSTQRWTSFQDIGPSPCGRKGHAMASDGRRIFVLGGELSPGSQVDEDRPIHVLDTTLLIYAKPDSNTSKNSEKTTELAQKPELSAGNPTHDQPQHVMFSSSDAGATRGVSSTEHHAKLVASDAPSRKEIARLEDGRHIELERQLSETLVAKTERDRRIAQLTDELALKSALLDQAAEEKKRTQLEMQAKLDDSLLSRDQAEANAAEVKERAELEQRELQAKLDDLLLSRDQALDQAQSSLQNAAEVNERSQREPAEVHAKLEARESELAAVRLRLMDAEVGWAKSKAEADTLRAGTQAAADLVNVDVERVMRRLMERVRAVEAEMASLQGNEKSIGEMECRNEG